jgi:hypothetical protein
MMKKNYFKFKRTLLTIKQYQLLIKNGYDKDIIKTWERNKAYFELAYIFNKMTDKQYKYLIDLGCNKNDIKYFNKKQANNKIDKIKKESSLTSLKRSV